MRGYEQFPKLLPVDIPFEENKFINYYDFGNKESGKGWGNTAVDVGFMKRMSGKSAAAAR